MSREMNQALRELAGVFVCERPGCFRVLKPDQGTVNAAGRRTCYTAACQDWARVRS